MSYEVDYACLTDAGKINLINEDNTSIFRNAKGDILMVVADGIGGRKKGDYASKIVIDYFSNSFIKKNGFFCIFTAKYWLKKKIKEINQIIFNISKNSEEYKGMGTTIVVLLIIKNKVIIMNVGDSCAFLFVKENKILKLLSQDHSYISVSKVLKNKNNTINSENYQNIILNSIGTYSYIEPYCKVINTKNFNDFSLLLCSDGLTKNVKNEEIIDILNNNYGDSASEIVNKLIKRANENGGTDNISVAYFIKNKYGND